MTLLGIGLATPGEPLAQTDLLQMAHRYNASTQRGRDRLDRIYRGTKVQQRHSALTTFGSPMDAALDAMFAFYPDPEQADPPSTAARMSAYERAALPLATSACEQALTNSGTDAKQITQLITVSCTGFSSPGLSLGLIDTLGLDAGVGRTDIGFMGCHGAINGLRVADALAGASADPGADPGASSGQRVLLCCAELCTLHFQYGDDAQDAVANALFADGAAALVGINQSDNHAGPTLRSCRSVTLAQTAELMSWRIGDSGFKMRISPEVPTVVQKNLRGFIVDWLSPMGLSIADIAGWAIHPGGPKVIDAVDAALDLPTSASAASRGILAAFGNMSSPTVLFIVDRLMRENTPRPWVVLAFGPGLTIEAALIV